MEESGSKVVKGAAWCNTVPIRLMEMLLLLRPTRTQISLDWLGWSIHLLKGIESGGDLVKH